jgi:hypothetical protein
MTEHDAFELRLAAAVHGYAGRAWSDLDPVELAHRIAAAQPRRRGVSAALGWRDAAIPPRIWVPLLLASLLAAMVGGMLIAGSQPVQQLPAVVPPVGEVFVCPPGSNPDEPGPVDQARPPQSGNVATAFDRRAGRLVAVTNAGNGVETWTFDVCANTWARTHPDQEPRLIDWWPLVYDIDSDATILITRGTVWAYDLQADTWTAKQAAPTGNAAPWAYDPRTGLIVVWDYNNAAALWGYDVEPDMWTSIHQVNSPGDTSPPAAVYDASVDRFITYGPWLLDIRSGTWAMSAAVAPALTVGFGMQAPRLEYDEAAQRTVVFANDELALYDATADRWETLNEADHGGSLPLSMVYDPVNRRLVGWRAHPFDLGDVIAFHLVTRERTVLLEPSQGQPAPSSR